MTKPAVSIVLSSHNRLPLYRRTLWSIAARGPSVPYELVVCDDNSDQEVLGETRLYAAKFPWKFCRFEAAAFEAATGLRKFLNNPCATNNVAARLAEGEALFQQGNEVIATPRCYDSMLAAGRELSERTAFWMVMSTTYDVPPQLLERLDSFGTNLTPKFVEACSPWPLQSRSYRSDVTNYISLVPRALWEEIGGYDERYYAGISAEDSDFVRRARALPSFEMRVVDDAVSLHQAHGGKTRYYDPPASYCTQERWKEGAAINRRVYDAWDQTHHNRQGWDWGTLGLGEVISNVRPVAA